MTVQGVMLAFFEGTAGVGGRLHTNGKELWCFHWLLARRSDKGKVELIVLDPEVPAAVRKAHDRLAELAGFLEKRRM